MAMKSARPALRIFDNHLARSLYLDWLAFQLNWEQRPEHGGPSMMEVKRDDDNSDLIGTLSRWDAGNGGVHGDRRP